MSRNRPSRPAELEALRREWYGKLTATGFEDIEYLGAGDPYSHLSLKDPASELAHRIHPAVWESRSEYWALVGKFAHVHHFSTELERECWEHFAAGCTYRQIARLVGRHHTRVFQLVSRVLSGPFDRYLKLSCSGALDDVTEVIPVRSPPRMEVM